MNMEEVINNYFTLYYAIQTSNSSVVIGLPPLEVIQTNTYLKYTAIHINEVYSIRDALNYSNTAS